MQDSLPAGGQPLPGRIHLPGSLKKVSALSTRVYAASPFPRLGPGAQRVAARGVYTSPKVIRFSLAKSNLERADRDRCRRSKSSEYLRRRGHFDKSDGTGRAELDFGRVRPSRRDDHIQLERVQVASVEWFEAEIDIAPGGLRRHRTLGRYNVIPIGRRSFDEDALVAISEGRAKFEFVEVAISFVYDLNLGQEEVLQSHRRASVRHRDGRLQLRRTSRWSKDRQNINS